MDHFKKKLMHCKYPKWAIDIEERRLTNTNSKEYNDANNQGTTGAKYTTKTVKSRVT